MDTAQPISPKTAPGAARRPSPGTGCTSRRNGRMICGPRSFCESRSAGSVPGGTRRETRADAPGPRTWTTSSHTTGTGPCSRIVETCRAFATPATAVRPWRKSVEKARLCGAGTGDDRAQLWAHAHGAAPARMRGGDSLRDPPRGQKSFARTAQDRMQPSTREILPTGSVRKAARVLQIWILRCDCETVSESDTGKGGAVCPENDSPRRWWRPTAAST